MAVTPNERFVREISSILTDQGLKRRRVIVRCLLSQMAVRFDSRLKGHVDSQLPSSSLDAQFEDILSRFRYSRDERDESEFVTPALLGALVEQFGTDRAASGTYYTPASIAAYMCRRGLEILVGALSDADRRRVAHQLRTIRVIDPACGSGALLVAMQQELAFLHFDAQGETQLCGLDVDELAVAAARIRTVCALNASHLEIVTQEFLRTILVGDGLATIDQMPRSGTFDLVVTNPPYGITADLATRNRFFEPRHVGVQSRDMYGLFIAQSLNLLRPGGVAVLLVSDTWRTIRRHLPLRRLLVDNCEVVSITDLPSWIFSATVNSGLVILRKTPPSSQSFVCATDLRSTPKGDWNTLSKSLTEQAAYRYRQSQVAAYARMAFFIGSPKIHRILTDDRFTTLGEIATVRQGLATGDNKRYLRKLPSARGGYLTVDPSTVLAASELAELSSEEKLNGLPRSKFGGRVFVPYDKGGASLSEEGWLPNYYVPTEYFIDWSEESVAAMKTTTSARQRGKIAARFQNADCYFKQGITFSYTGYYAPSFRLSSGGVFDVGGSSCFDLQLPLYPVLAILASKLMKYIAKNYINHTVNFQVDDFKALPLPGEIDEHIAAELDRLVTTIVERQKGEPKYRYSVAEQREIDRIVFALFNISEIEVLDINRWYEEAYPRLSTGS